MEPCLWLLGFGWQFFDSLHEKNERLSFLSRAKLTRTGGGGGVGILTRYVPLWSGAVWGCCYSKASCVRALENSSEKWPATASEKLVKTSWMPWAFHAATGSPSVSSPGPRWAMDFDSGDYPLQVPPKCPDLLLAESCFQSNSCSQKSLDSIARI